MDSTQTFAYVQSITLEGNRKTKPAWILRELEFAPGDSIPLAALGPTLERNRLLLMNTGLFSQAKINVKHWESGNRVALHIELRESWYIWPVPLFSLADRNFNVWWHDFKRDLNRVNFGLYVQHDNLTGRADLAKVGFQLGYARKYELDYNRPGLNRSQTLGLRAGFWYALQHETFFKTEGSRLFFFENAAQFQSERLVAYLSLAWRPGLRTWHTFTLERHDNHVSDTVAHVLNRNFFLDGQTRQQHWSFIVNVEKDQRDIRPFPLHGFRWILDLRQNGLLPTDDLHLFRLFGEFDRYFSFSKRASLELIALGRTSLPRRKPPYFNNQALGYGQSIVRGYEYFVADGLDYAVLKSSLRFMVFYRTFDFGRLMPFKNMRLLPIRLYLAANNDLGYANDPHYTTGSPLSNRPLWGYGFGLSVVGYYNRVATVEWSRNDLGLSGFYLRVNTGI